AGYLQRVPLLRGLLRRLPRDGAAAPVHQRRSVVPRQPLPQLQGLLLRLPVRTAAPVRRQRAEDLRRAADGVIRRLRVASTARRSVPAQWSGRVARGGARDRLGADPGEPVRPAIRPLWPAYGTGRVLRGDPVG